MSYKYFRLVVVDSALIAFLLLMSSSFAMAEEIRVTGAGAAMSAIFSPIKESFEKSTGHKLKLTITSPAKSLIALWKGEADIATATGEPVQVIDAAAKEGVTIDPATIESFVIGQNRTVVFVDKANKVKSLSKKQLKNIFTGKVKNWQELGGANRKITVVWGKTPGQNALFTSRIMDGEALTPNAQAATDYENIRDIVAKTPGAIGIGPFGLIKPTIKSPQVPLLLSPINVYTKGKPSEKARLVLDYYREEFGFFGN